MLTSEERKAINEGRWFSSLSPTLRHDILRCATVMRFDSGQLIAKRGSPADQWLGCAKGVARISSVLPTGKQLITLDYVQPGIWFGDVSMLGGPWRTHDIVAHGPTTMLSVTRTDFERIMGQHPEFSRALLKLQAQRILLLTAMVQDFAVLPLRARLAKQIYHLARNYGVPLPVLGEWRITLQLAQEELAQMLGASRQRVNQELKAMEREGVLRVESDGLVVCHQEMLLRIGDAPYTKDYSAMPASTDQFTGTRPVASSHSFDQKALFAWLKAHISDFDDSLIVEQFKGGQSNPTYKLITPNRAYVMRTKPGPASALLPSAHAIEREFAVMKALAGSDVPVAQMLALCEDESVIGRAFFIMSFVSGRVLWDQTLPGMTRQERTDIYDELNRVIAALHVIDYKQIGLENFGKPGNYFERQIGRWSKQYLASITTPIIEMDRLIEWLPANIPLAASTNNLSCIVHGDYRLDNLIFHASEPRALATLDWELSTLGHPLADFSYHCMSWHIEPGRFRGIGGTDLKSLGIPSEQEYIRRYCERTGFTTLEKLQPDWNFYLAYNMFRIAAILQGIAKRVEAGTASSAQAKSSGAGARPMAELAWRYAQKHQELHRG